MSEWTPIIDPASELGGRARIVLEAITAQVPGTSDHLEASLFLSYKARADGNGRWAEAAIQQLNLAIRQAEAMWSTRRLGLYGGLAGLGFVVAQVAREAPDVNEDTDEALLLELQRGRWQGDPYLATGLTGAGVYFLERLPVPAARKGLELVAGHLDEMLGRANTPYAAGVSEGIWGIAHFLCRLAASGVEKERAQGLRERISGWLDATTAAAATPGECPEIAAVCLQIGLPEAGRTLIERCLSSAWPLSRAAGVAHTWNRIWRLNQDPACRTAAVEWLDHAVIGLDRSSTGSERFWIGLVLLAAITPVEPEWDRILCLSGTQTPELQIHPGLSRGVS
jgi:hypothetical protein